MSVVNPDPYHATVYKSFVIKRHAVWHARQAGLPQEHWTADPVLNVVKFTNMFRILDPGSQFVLTDLAPAGAAPKDVLTRLFLYRYTNYPQTWRHMRDVLGHYPTDMDIGPDLTMLLQDYRDEGNQIFSGAYMIIPQPGHKGDKIAMCINLARDFTDNHYGDFMAAENEEERLAVLMRPYGVGKFLAQQILIDWGYTEHGGDRDNEHVVRGPGSTRGAALIDPKAAPEDVFRWAQEHIGGAVSLELPDGRLRYSSLRDVQNHFCEYMKFNRATEQVSAGTKKVEGRQYHPAHPGAQPDPVFPVHW